MNLDFFEKLLNYYSITNEDYQDLIRPVTIENFMSSYKFNRIEEASHFVHEEINRGGKIMIYGDYDADGIMGTSILVKMFQYIAYRAKYYVPSRYLDGYGLTLEKAKEALQDGITLLITVDNGISALEPIKFLKDNGIKVVVLDHHTIQDEIPPADYIIHPEFSNFNGLATSGAFVVFSFSLYFLNRFDKYLSTLASISLISDMMPLKNFNRDFLRLVFSNYRKGEFKAVDLLLGDDNFDENSIGMKIAPKINAVGRIIKDTSVNELIEYFTNDDLSTLLNYIQKIEQINTERKNISKTMCDNIPKEDINSTAIVTKIDIIEGLLGLVANHLMNKYHVPTIVFCEDQFNELKGSCRAPEGFDTVNAFNSLSNYLSNFGGHALAGGCSLSKDNYNVFKEKFIEYAKNNPIQHVEKPSLKISISDINKENANLINSLSPFGEAWKAPLLRIENINVSSLKYSRSYEHIMTNIGINSRLVGFGISRDSLKDKKIINITGNLKTSKFLNYSYYDFNIKEVL